MRCIQLRRHGGLAMPRPLGAPLRAKRRLRKIRYMTPLGRRTTTTTTRRSRKRKRREGRRGTRSGGVARPLVRVAMRRNSVRPLPFGASRSWLASGVLRLYRLRYFLEELRRSSSVKLQQQHCRSQRSSNQRHLQSLRRRRRRRRRRRLVTRCSRNCRQA